MAARQIVQGTTAHRNWKYITWGLFTLAVLLFVFAYVDTGSINIGEDNSYSISMIRVNKAIAFAIAILGLQIIVGFTGQIALGQSFFFGMGAYITAWLVADHSWPYLLTLVVVVPASFLVGMLMGLPALRIRGLYLALVTLGMAAVFPSIVKLRSLEDYTGGSGGKSTAESKLVAPSWLPLDGIAEALQKIPLLGQYFGDGPMSSRMEDRMWKFILFAIVALVCLWLVSNLVRSRPGRAMRAIRDNETGAAVSGIDLSMTKTLAFGVGSALGGVGGTIYVMEVGIASPDDFTQLIAINFIVGLVVGGVGTLSGAVVGGFIVAFVPDWASSTQSVSFLPERWLQGPTGSLILGVMLITLTFFLPGGIVSGFRRLKARFVQIVPQRPDGAAAAIEFDADDDVPDDASDDSVIVDVAATDGASSQG